MAIFDTLTAVAAPLGTDNIDTDQIFPARFSSRRRENGEFGTYFFHDQRYDSEGKENKDFVLNDIRFKGAKIIVGAGNYACGSGRIGAIYAHIDFGIRAVIAESFGPVFPQVAYKSGLLTIQVSKENANSLRGNLISKPGSKITIDLNIQKILLADAAPIEFEIDCFVKQMLLKGVQEIDITLTHREHIENFEARHKTRLPWLYELKESK